MLLHAFANILVKKLFGNNLVGRFPYVSHTITRAGPIDISCRAEVWRVLARNKIVSFSKSRKTHNKVDVSWATASSHCHNTSSS